MIHYQKNADKYHVFKDIVGHVYENGSTIDLKSPEYSSFDTGGYTGVWGPEGRLAMLHQKELVLNQPIFKNILEHPSKKPKNFMIMDTYMKKF